MVRCARQGGPVKQSGKPRRKLMMEEPRENRINFGWITIVILLILGIDGLLTRLLESLWVPLRERNSAAYLPLEWWMSAPFTLFVFVILSALLTSFSSVKNWFRTFLLLCGFKVVFAAITAFFFSFRPYPDVVEAVLQASFLSLPTVLVHLFLSGMAVMFLRDLSAAKAMKEEPAYPILGESATGTPLAGTGEQETEAAFRRVVSEEESAAEVRSV
jgi:hypothetical protein